jgi:hypothetical protein
MKTIMILIAGLMISVGASAQSSENKEYRDQAIAAAKAINSLNWGTAAEDRFEIIKEAYVNSELNSSGTYLVRLYQVDKKSKKKSDGGKDFEVYVYGGAVLRVLVDCRLCG